ncbi:methyltransferase family protein [Solimonas marina]|uniref:Isoprenylcysteine carboxylmethyltransferase family protein n=1 Tax=Solimonas marina TaxID=2714601 RepID=A0A969WBR7_9GAMM|nr:isoprenylcysteine carboxylmethyltransferase family protein [Solimonas marina]NKF23638.1 isoprenylcysteine carboxylmethyltransferase family protein [Solimonas marina]
MTTLARASRLRIPLSRAFAASLIAVLLFNGSYWDSKGMMLGDLLTTVGLGLIGIATVGRLWCNAYIVGYKNNVLLMSGPYSVSRNPLYFFSSLGAVGVGLMSESLTVTATIALLFVATYRAVIRAEEQRLEGLHGDTWRQYVARVPRFWPKLSQLEEPERYTIHPQQFRRHLFDALWFTWAAGIMLLIETLHDSGILTVLWHAP